MSGTNSGRAEAWGNAIEIKDDDFVGYLRTVNGNAAEWARANACKAAANASIAQGIVDVIISLVGFSFYIICIRVVLLNLCIESGSRRSKFLFTGDDKCAGY